MSRRQTLGELRRLLREQRYEIDFEALADCLMGAGLLAEPRRVRRRERSE